MLRVALKSATVEDFLQVLISRLTRYDMQVSRRERIPNIYRLGHWLQAAESVRDDVRAYLERDDEEAMGALRRALNKEFHVGDMPPVKQVLKQMDNWEQKGRTPKLAADMANRVASRFVYGYDRHALRELELYMENESSIYRQKQSIIENIKRKMKSGRYNSSLAPKLWMYWVDAGAKKYVKEFGGPGARVRDMFPKDVRMALAKQFAEEYEEQIKAGEYGDITSSDHTSLDTIYAEITGSTKTAVDLPSEEPGGKPAHDEDFKAGFKAGQEAYKKNDRADASTAQRAYKRVRNKHGIWWVHGFTAAIDSARGAYAMPYVQIAKRLHLVASSTGRVAVDLPSEEDGGKPGYDDDFKAGYEAGKKAYKDNDRVDKSHAEKAYKRVSSKHGSWWIDGFTAAIDIARGATATKPAQIAKKMRLAASSFEPSFIHTKYEDKDGKTQTSKDSWPTPFGKPSKSTLAKAVKEFEKHQKGATVLEAEVKSPSGKTLARYKKASSEDPNLAAVRKAMQLTAALKAKDKKVIDAFADEKPAEGLMLRSTGKVLEKMGMGGGTFAKWDGGKIRVVMETSARSDDSILRYMKKSIPSGRLHDHPQLKAAGRRYQVGDQVQVTTKGLQLHSRKTPGGMGYSKHTINWRKNLSDRKGKPATVQQVFPSGGVDIEYPDGYYVQVYDYMLEPA